MTQENTKHAEWDGRQHFTKDTNHRVNEITRARANNNYDALFRFINATYSTLKAIFTEKEQDEIEYTRQTYYENLEEMQRIRIKHNGRLPKIVKLNTYLPLIRHQRMLADKLFSDFMQAVHAHDLLIPVYEYAEQERSWDSALTDMGL